MQAHSWVHAVTNATWMQTVTRICKDLRPTHIRVNAIIETHMGACSHKHIDARIHTVSGSDNYVDAHAKAHIGDSRHKYTLTYT